MPNELIEQADVGEYAVWERMIKLNIRVRMKAELEIASLPEDEAQMWRGILHNIDDVGIWKALVPKNIVSSYSVKEADNPTVLEIQASAVYKKWEKRVTLQQIKG